MMGAEHPFRGDSPWLCQRVPGSATVPGSGSLRQRGWEGQLALGVCWEIRQEELELCFSRLGGVVWAGNVPGKGADLSPLAGKRSCSGAQPEAEHASPPVPSCPRDTDGTSGGDTGLGPWDGSWHSSSLCCC